ncbi:LCP family protein [Caloranaerobacter ferrireducens]|uniref:LCP family protein n=1 Tax=Caloranaerobacter ferrireducens TaxID=1323370 RepID=UPI00084CFCA6|nr:LCP family protein [Caloranaerobacter ferrireducens]
MKQFLKVFTIAFFCFVLAIGAGVFTFMKFYDANAATQEDLKNVDNNDTEDNSDSSNDNSKSLDPFKKAIQESKRINILLLGLEGPRTDTIIFASFDPVTKKVDLISIPRDTYFYRLGYEEADKRKINAVYGDAGVKGTMKAVEAVLGGVPIHHYVKVTYSGVEKIVDSLGGVEVDVPFDMVYDDPTAKPPLHINLKKGRQILNGEKAVQFLRFRQNNDKTVGYPDGDLGRIRAQQQFIKSAVKKALSFRLPVVAQTCFKYIKTDMSLTDTLLYVSKAIGIKIEDVSMTTLPGRAIYKSIDGKRVSYFAYDSKQIRELMMKLYNVNIETEN